MCKITGCKGKVVARGLCAKHYMRTRRTGDPAKTGKPGRPPEMESAYMDMAREVWGPDRSPRTQARIAAAFYNLDQCSPKARGKVVAECFRPNGTINVSQLLQRSIDLWWLEHPEDRDE
jgi:hypothetical protein